MLRVGLEGADGAMTPRQLVRVGGSVVCDYGSALKCLRVPLAQKIE